MTPTADVSQKRRARGRREETLRLKTKDENGGPRLLSTHPLAFAWRTAERQSAIGNRQSAMEVRSRNGNEQRAVSETENRKPQHARRLTSLAKRDRRSLRTPTRNLLRKFRPPRKGEAGQASPAVHCSGQRAAARRERPGRRNGRHTSPLRGGRNRAAVSGGGRASPCALGDQENPPLRPRPASFVRSRGRKPSRRFGVGHRRVVVGNQSVPEGA